MYPVLCVFCKQIHLIPTDPAIISVNCHVSTLYINSTIMQSLIPAIDLIHKILNRRCMSLQTKKGYSSPNGKARTTSQWLFLTEVKECGCYRVTPSKQYELQSWQSKTRLTKMGVCCQLELQVHPRHFSCVLHPLLMLLDTAVRQCEQTYRTTK